MATVIKLKRGTSTPTTSDLASGEVAIDTAAQKFYVNDAGTVKEVGVPGNFSTLSDVTFTDLAEGDEIYYDGSEWVNQSGGIKVIPFIEADATAHLITLINSTTVTTVQQFLNSVVTKQFHLPFIKADGTAVTTLVIG